MAFKLSKEQVRQKAQLTSKLRQAEEAYEAARFAYNEAIGEASQWVGLVALGFQSEFDNRSERWRGGATGEGVSIWLEEWNGFDPELIDRPEPAADALEGLSDQPQ